MNDVKELLSTDKQLKKARVHKRFKSKKNIVYLLSIEEKIVVMKWFKNRAKDYMQKEYELLSQTQTSFRKPQVIKKNDEHNFLLLHYINGSNVCDLINDYHVSSQRKTEIIRHLSNWFAQFHQTYYKNVYTMIHGDANLRNFLFKNDIYGLDFEEVKQGKPVEDIADIYASILTTDPGYTKEKNRIGAAFLQTYQSIVPYTLENVEEMITVAIKKRQRKKRVKTDYKS